MMSDLMTRVTIVIVAVLITMGAAFYGLRQMDAPATVRHSVPSASLDPDHVYAILDRGDYLIAQGMRIYSNDRTKENRDVLLEVTRRYYSIVQAVCDEASSTPRCSQSYQLILDVLTALKNEAQIE